MIPSQHVSAEQLQRFFRPRSIALVGATDNSRWSLYTFENLKNLAFAGPVYLVNPRRETVHGTRAYPSLQHLPEPVDLAFVMVPTPGVLPVVREAAALGTRHFVVLTSGFSEMGALGAELERELLMFAQEHALTILGPNGNGFINVTDQITPYGLPIATPLKSGPVGVVLQSGALASAVLAFAQGHAIGLSLLVAMGCSISPLSRAHASQRRRSWPWRFRRSRTSPAWSGPPGIRLCLSPTPASICRRLRASPWSGPDCISAPGWSMAYAR
jgi:acetate---CoA ligase (ADP-forming)